MAPDGSYMFRILLELELVGEGELEREVLAVEIDLVLVEDLGETEGVAGVDHEVTIFVGQADGEKGARICRAEGRKGGQRRPRRGHEGTKGGGKGGRPDGDTRRRPNMAATRTERTERGRQGEGDKRDGKGTKKGAIPNEGNRSFF